LKTVKSVQQKTKKLKNKIKISSIGAREKKKLRNSVDREVEIQAL
jgi:hypothetical protein